MELKDVAYIFASPLALPLAILSIVGPALFLLFTRPSFPKNAPKQAPDQYPFIGGWHFFKDRLSWFERQKAASKTGNFSFYAGNKPVVGISGETARKVFFGSKSLGFSEGYEALFAGAPTDAPDTKEVNEKGETQNFSHYFSKRLIAMMKASALVKSLPDFIGDVCARMDELAAQKEHITDPFESIYFAVFQLTMRSVGAKEIADDEKILEKTLSYFELVENAVSPLSLIYSSIPTWGKLMRTYGGARIYMIFDKLVKERKRTGRREEDAMQYLMDQGDDTRKIISFVIGALFAGQLNSGINAAFILLSLADNPTWFSKVVEEVRSVAAQHTTDSSRPLREQLKDVPYGAWENEFPMIDLCLKDSMRLNLNGTSFRQNVTSQDLSIGHGEVIPAGAYVAWHTSDTHGSEEIYPNWQRWDPGRYLPERAEDKKAPLAWSGWGLARHPCLGMRFAKLEIYILVAFWVAYFDNTEVVDAVSGKKRAPPAINFEGHSASKPKDRGARLKFEIRKD